MIYTHAEKTESTSVDEAVNSIKTISLRLICAFVFVCMCLLVIMQLQVLCELY